MKYKVLFMEGEVFKSDEFCVTAEHDSRTVAEGIGELYERLNVEVLGVVRVAEIDVALH